jgi:hypothetical protein
VAPAADRKGATDSRVYQPYNHSLVTRLYTALAAVAATVII